MRGHPRGESRPTAQFLDGCNRQPCMPDKHRVGPRFGPPWRRWPRMADRVLTFRQYRQPCRTFHKCSPSRHSQGTRCDNSFSPSSPCRCCCCGTVSVVWPACRILRPNKEATNHLPCSRRGAGLVLVVLLLPVDLVGTSLTNPCRFRSANDHHLLRLSIPPTIHSPSLVEGQSGVGGALIGFGQSTVGGDTSWHSTSTGAKSCVNRPTRTLA